MAEDTPRSTGRSRAGDKRAGDKDDEITPPTGDIGETGHIAETVPMGEVEESIGHVILHILGPVADVVAEEVGESAPDLVLDVIWDITKDIVIHLVLDLLEVGRLRDGEDILATDDVKVILNNPDVRELIEMRVREAQLQGRVFPLPSARQLAAARDRELARQRRAKNK